MVGVIGKAIKGVGKALKSRGRKPGVFDKVIGKGVVDRNVKSKEVFKTIQGLRKKPYKGAKENLDKIYKKKGINYKKIAKKTAPIAAAGAAGVAYGERKGKK